MTTLNSVWRATPRPLRAAAVGLVRGLSRPSSAAALLLGYAVLWTISAEIRNLSVPLHGDMVEAFALSRDPSLGYVKHPPLINWITAAWFAAVPIAHWPFYLLAYLNAALAMWAVWLAAGYVVDARRRTLAVALLGLTPIFTFLAATFNHNTIQLSLWPLVALTFLASIERQNLIWSVLFGVASGLALLSKYFAGLIVIACMLATLLHPNRRSYLCSPRPYLAATTCMIVLAPNLYWLVAADFISIRIQIAKQPDNDALRVATLVLRCIGTYVTYLAPPAIAMWLCMRPWTIATVRAIIEGWPARRRVIACIALAPILLPLLAFAAVGIGMSAVWIQPAYFFAPLVVVSAPQLLVARRAVTAIVGSVAALAVLAVAASPILMVGNFFIDRMPKAEPFIPLAHFATDTWHDRTGRPLEFVSGSQFAIWSVSFYSDDHPVVFPGYGHLVPQSEVERHWKERGVLGICHAGESWCNEMFQRALPTAERLEITLPFTFLGLRREPVSYVLYLAPGRNER